MDIAHLLISLDVEVAQLLAGGVFEGLLEVGVQAAPARRGLGGDLVVLVKAAGALGRVEFLVEIAQGGGEAVREAVLLVQGDGLLDGVVADDVPVRQVLGDDARARLVFLGDLVLFGFLGGAGAGCFAFG